MVIILKRTASFHSHGLTVQLSQYGVTVAQVVEWMSCNWMVGGLIPALTSAYCRGVIGLESVGHGLDPECVQGPLK